MSDGRALRLVIFDVDGTLLDSASHIVSCMSRAFRTVGLDPPSADATRDIIGLELREAIARLAGADVDAARLGALFDAYRAAALAARTAGQGEGATPLFPGARRVLQSLGAEPHTLLGVATGKARPGLVHMIEGHRLESVFVTTQTVTENPGKPHPGMVERAMAETGVEAARTVVIGDTSFDMEMARNAGVAAIGVAWGSHAPERLERTGAAVVVAQFEEIETAVAELIGA